MASNASFTINDGTDDHVFSPAGIDGNTATYQNKAESFIPGRETAVLKRRSGNAVREVTQTIRVPKVVTETINGVDMPKVASFGTVQYKVLVPKDWTPTEIALLNAIGQGSVSTAAFVAAAEEDEWVW